MTGDNLPDEASERDEAPEVEVDAAPEPTDADEASGSVLVADDEAVREGIDAVQRQALPGFVLAHADSPLAWAELADVAHSEGRAIEAYAYATVAHQRGLELLASAGWTSGDPIPWADAPNQAVLRAAYALKHAAAVIGRDDEARSLEEFLVAADPDATARIASEHTPTQLITIIPPGATAPVERPSTEAFVIRGED